MTTEPFSMNRRQIMTKYLEIMKTQTEFEDVLGVPPLDIILYRDLMEATWSSDRLFPWTPGYVSFEFYSCYLNEYFYRNTPSIFNTDAAARRCLEMEEKLSCATALTDDFDALSKRIKEQANLMLNSEFESHVAAAGFMCIAEEAELMSELLSCETKNSVENDVFITEVLDDDSFNFSNKVRKAAFEILTTYKGPWSVSVAAPLLGMRKEANLVRELLKLNENHMDRVARLNICECLRERLLKFLISIHDRKLLHDTAPGTAISCSHQDMVTCLEIMKTRTEFEDVKEIPPLGIILYRDLMETTWSCDRLLPWKSGDVPFEFYLAYLTEYFYRNTPAINVGAAARTCLEMEDKLSCARVFTADVDELSKSIKERALLMSESEDESPVAAAGFMCIAEEAKLMSGLLACETKNSLEKDVFITEVLDDDSYKFSKTIRNIVFDILITYEGPCSDSIAASFLGMKKEASILRELLELNQNHMDRFARLNICESQRQLLRKFLTDICKFKFPILMTSVRAKESGQADEMLCPLTDDGIAVASTPTTSNDTTPDTAISWAPNDGESGQEKDQSYN